MGSSERCPSTKNKSFTDIWKHPHSTCLNAEPCAMQAAKLVQDPSLLEFSEVLCGYALSTFGESRDGECVVAEVMFESP